MPRTPRLLSLAVLATVATALPVAPASAASVPCADLGLVRAGACDTATGASVSARSASRRCPGTDLLPTASNLPRIRRATLCLINGERQGRGLKPVREQRVLRGAAAKYARQMVRGRFFSHDAPTGSTMVSRIRTTTYLRDAAVWSLGENLAWGTGALATPGRTVRAWLDSPGHRRVMLEPRYRDIGIGIAAGAPVDARSASTAATYATEYGLRR